MFPSRRQAHLAGAHLNVPHGRAVHVRRWSATTKASHRASKIESELDGVECVVLYGLEGVYVSATVYVYM